MLRGSKEPALYHGFGFLLTLLMLKNYLTALEIIVLPLTLPTARSGPCQPHVLLPLPSSVWVSSHKLQNSSSIWVSIVIGLTFKIHIPFVPFRYLGFTKLLAKISFPPHHFVGSLVLIIVGVDYVGIIRHGLLTGKPFRKERGEES